MKIDKVTASLWRKVRELQQQVNQTVGAVWGSIEGNLNDQTDLKNALDSKANTTSILSKDNTNPFTPTQDYHPATKKYVDDNAGGGSSPVWGNITGTLSNQTDLQNALNSKANSTHTHTKTDISDFAHNHPISDITNLQTTLDNKANISHAHPISDITNLQTSLDDKVSKTGNETINGVKTFTSFPVTPSLSPVNDYDVANKKYVDDKTAGGGGGSNVTTCKQTAVVTNSTTTPTDITGLAFNLTSGRRYHFKFLLTFQTAATTTGIGFDFTSPAMSFANWKASIRQAAAGTDSFYENSATSLSTQITSASIVTANADFIAIVEGFCQPSADGTLQLRVRSEVAGSQVTVQNQGMGFLIDAG